MYVQHIDNMDVRTLVLSKGHRLKAVKTSSLGGYMVLPLSISCPWNAMSRWKYGFEYSGSNLLLHDGSKVSMGGHPTNTIALNNVILR